MDFRMVIYDFVAELADAVERRKELAANKYKWLVGRAAALYWL